MVTYNHNRINKLTESIMAKNRKVHCRQGEFVVNGKSFLLCGIRHQGPIQGFPPTSFLDLDPKDQCQKCRVALENREQ